MAVKEMIYQTNTSMKGGLGSAASTAQQTGGDVLLLESPKPPFHNIHRGAASTLSSSHSSTLLPPERTWYVSCSVHTVTLKKRTQTVLSFFRELERENDMDNWSSGNRRNSNQIPFWGWSSAKAGTNFPALSVHPLCDEPGWPHMHPHKYKDLDITVWTVIWTIHMNSNTGGATSCACFDSVFETQADWFVLQLNYIK